MQKKKNNLYHNAYTLVRERQALPVLSSCAQPHSGVKQLGAAVTGEIQLCSCSPQLDVTCLFTLLEMMHEQSSHTLELCGDRACSVRMKSSKIVAVKIKEVSSKHV